MLGLKFNHVSKRAPGDACIFGNWAIIDSGNSRRNWYFISSLAGTFWSRWPKIKCRFLFYHGNTKLSTLFSLCLIFTSQKVLYFRQVPFCVLSLSTDVLLTLSIELKMLLTHWGRDKMAAILQTTVSKRFSWMETFEFRLKFHWSLSLRLQSTIFQHWFRQWLGADQATSHYLNQWLLVFLRIYASLGFNELKWRQETT